ncbi:MAG: L-arabinose isomerase [Spirochaetes bacterium]|nr:L-arabinose isomerase [Spirochaetota bacterium]MBN2769454.1 L-arabinose isomerase [Spirochaetota bacterium]
MELSSIYKESQIWFFTGTQHLYGEDIFSQIKEHSQTICETLSGSPSCPVKIVFKSLLSTPDGIYRALGEAQTDMSCAGVVLWMHTFSPAKMWIRGLKSISKPVLHLHTQFNRDIPFKSIDMDFMNLNQSAHGDREFGFITARLGVNREVVAGHYSEESVQRKVADWARVAVGWKHLQGMKVARFGDNMREVAVTEGDKVEAQIKFGYSVNGYGVSDLVRYIDSVSDIEAARFVESYCDNYEVSSDLLKGGANHQSLIYAAKQDAGLERFLTDGGFSAFTTTFEDLEGLDQLPGFACQRMMEKGYGFGAEGDWKTAAFVNAAKVIAYGNDTGTSFMEDYTYHFDPLDSMVLGAHMLEVCPSLAAKKPKIELHPLGIGGKNSPVRMIFDSAPGDAINATIVDMGDRFRMIINRVTAVESRELPKLPVARVLLKPQPDLETAAAAWILAGGAHHTVYTKSVTSEQFSILARLADIEILSIDSSTSLDSLRNEIRWNEMYFRMRN